MHSQTHKPHAHGTPTMSAGWRRMRLCVKAMAISAPAGGARSACRMRRLTTAATVYAGTKGLARNVSTSAKNYST
jgi:hypothetical protein